MATQPCTRCGAPIADSVLTCPQCGGTDPEAAKEGGKRELLGCLGCTAWIWLLPLMPFAAFPLSQCPLTCQLFNPGAKPVTL